ncbi:MAG: ABC transporter substrate-binding protein [Thermoflexales bacterium]|nr:ABC transporter substrate-binding protein [Thermoflexales bacterium]
MNWHTVFAHKKRLVAGGLAALVTLAACAAPKPPAPTRLVYGLTLAPSGIDPHINASSELGIPLTSVYDTLVYQDPASGRFVPGLAETWSVSDEGKTYTFKLRRGLKFHDGEPFNAQAVKTTFDRITNPDTKSQKAAFMLGAYQRSEVIDEYTVAIHLKEPFAPLLDSLSQVYTGIASPKALAQWGAEYQMHQVGTGPFKFVEYVPKDHLTLARNPDYSWGPEVLAHRGPAYLDEIVFKFYEDPATRALALEAGEVHVMGELPPQDAGRLAIDKRFSLHAVPIPGQPLQFFLNTQRPPTDDPLVRQALLYGTERAAIVKAIFGAYSPVAYGPLAAATLGFDPSLRSRYPYDPAKAQQLLDEAGWQDSDGDGWREKDGKRLHLDAVVMGYGLIPEVSQLLQAQWKSIGLELAVQQAAYGDLLQTGREGTVHVIPFLISGSDPDMVRSFFHSAGAFNWSKITDPELDGWLAQAARSGDWETRSPLYARVQQRVMEAALIVPVRDYVNLNVASSQVTGLRYDARGWFPWLVDVQLVTGD